MGKMVPLGHAQGVTSGGFFELSPSLGRGGNKADQTERQRELCPTGWWLSGGYIIVACLIRTNDYSLFNHSAK
jgi:hypothetical protein